MTQLIERILLPTDFSEYSSHAIPYACALADEYSAELHILHVLEKLPTVPYFGMGLATASTGLAVMTMTPAAEQGRNGASLNVGDALGSGLFVGLSGSIFAALHGTGDLSLTFGALLAAMILVGLLATASSLRVGPVRNESYRS